MQSALHPLSFKPSQRPPMTQDCPHFTEEDQPGGVIAQSTQQARGELGSEAILRDFLFGGLQRLESRSLDPQCPLKSSRGFCVEWIVESIRLSPGSTVSKSPDRNFPNFINSLPRKFAVSRLT